MRKGGKATANCYRNRGKSAWLKSTTLLCCVCVWLWSKTPAEHAFVFMQGQWGRFRNRLNRIGQHCVAHFRKTHRPIRWSTGILHWAGPSDLPDHTDTALSSHTAAVPRLQNLMDSQMSSLQLLWSLSKNKRVLVYICDILLAWNSLSSFVQSDLRSLTFCTYIWVLLIFI